MGFSVSASAALVFAGLLIAFGMWHTAASNSFEQVSEARSDRADATLDEKNTAIVIDEATYTTGTPTGTLTVNATNEGSTALSLNHTDLLIDNAYRSGWQGGATVNADTVDSESETDLWLPGETVTIEVEVEVEEPDRVKLATEFGVADTEGVTSS